jgi:ubiquinone/menaquinone biosynthesis C-methylase UbiE
MIHEVPDQDKLFKELKSILKPGGKIFIIEPIFHVTKTLFEEMITRARNIGFEIISGPKVFYSRTVLFSNKK